MMRIRIGSLWIVVFASIWATASYGTDVDTTADTVDSDGNGIQDRYEAGLAAKFVPAMVLDSRDNVSPEPVSFNTGSAEQKPSRDAEPHSERFYVGLQTGVLVYVPIFGIRAGWHPLSGAPGFALEVGYALGDEIVNAAGWPPEVVVPSIGIVLGSRSRRPRGYYFRLGLADIAIGMQKPLSDSVYLRPEIGAGFAATSSYYPEPYVGIILRVDAYI